MLRDLTYRIIKFWRSGDLFADLRETSREAETAAQLCGILREQPRPLRSSAGDLVPYSHSSGSYITTRHFVISYSSLLHPMRETEGAGYGITGSRIFLPFFCLKHSEVGSQIYG